MYNSDRKEHCNVNRRGTILNFLSLKTGLKVRFKRLINSYISHQAPSTHKAKAISIQGPVNRKLDEVQIEVHQV